MNIILYLIQLTLLFFLLFLHQYILGVNGILCTRNKIKMKPSFFSFSYIFAHFTSKRMCQGLVKSTSSHVEDLQAKIKRELTLFNLT